MCWQHVSIQLSSWRHEAPRTTEAEHSPYHSASSPDIPQLFLHIVPDLFHRIICAATSSAFATYANSHLVITTRHYLKHGNIVASRLFAFTDS